MTIQKNWESLYKFWKELNFEQLKACNLLVKKKFKEELEYKEEDINRLKEIIFDWSLVKIEFNPARKEEIKKLQKKLNVTLSKDFEESLKINIGDINKDEYVYSWLGQWHYMLDIDEIIKYSLDKREYYGKKKSISFEERVNLPDEYAYWNEKWLVFLDYNQDEQYILNLDTTNPNYGEVLSISMEFSTIERISNSYEEWFDTATKETLIYGEALFLE